PPILIPAWSNSSRTSVSAAAIAPRATERVSAQGLKYGCAYAFREPGRDGDGGVARRRQGAGAAAGRRGVRRRGRRQDGRPRSETAGDDRRDGPRGGGAGPPRAGRRARHTRR